MPFSVLAMAWPGEHREFVVEEFIKKCESPILTQRSFRNNSGLNRHDPGADKKTM